MVNVDKFGILVNIKKQIKTVPRKVSHKLIELGRIIGKCWVEGLEDIGRIYPPRRGR